MENVFNALFAAAMMVLFVVIPAACAVRLGLALLLPGRTRAAVKAHPYLHAVWALASIALVAGILNDPFERKLQDAKRYLIAKSNVTEIVAAVKVYEGEYGYMPAGGNEKITTALRGDNPRRIVFMTVDQRRINILREYTDPWGSPFRIDVANPKNPRVYSYGQNLRDDGGAEGSDDIVSWR